MLALDVEYLLGVCFAAREGSYEAPDWPPQIDRIFSAMVATWAARGERAEEKEALQWFETLPPPVVHASSHWSRTAPPVYVPPNDSGPSQIQVLPARRRRQQRRFPAAIPEHPIASYAWSTIEPQTGVLKLLAELARDIVYVGHSSSLVRCFFHQRPEGLTEQISQSTRRIYAGRFEELEHAFKRGVRPPTGLSFRAPELERKPRASVFGREWHVFADAQGLCPDVRRSAAAARALRTAIMSGFRGKPVPESLSGHTLDGQPSTQPHMAIFPLANNGWKWGDGRLMGLAICLPRDVSAEDEGLLFRALAEIAIKQDSPGESDSPDCEISVALPAGGTWRLVRQPEPLGSSLKPSRYLRSARIWATATPIALDCHPKAVGPEARQREIAGLIGNSCTRIGLPKPMQVVPDKHSAIRGSAPAIASQFPEWTRWTLPGSLKGRALTHATLVFEEPVAGPVALGAGRYFGLGLCLPIEAGNKT
jgi:CRISPR-associated protein Csb2